MPIALTNDESRRIEAIAEIDKIWQFPPDGTNPMTKHSTNRHLLTTTLFAVCFLCGSAAFGQTASVLSSNAQPLVLPEHALHASQHAMAQENSLLGVSAYSYAQGEQPLAQFGSLPYETPLGDVARAYRKEHAAVPKAAKVLEKQQ